jgi:simple sugar transport system ATP-binding protein
MPVPRKSQTFTTVEVFCIAPNLVEMKNISKSFGLVHALKDVNFNVGYGQIRGLVGDNGAGKTTLIEILAGMLKADSGEIFFEGRRLGKHDPMLAKKMGIETIHQRGNILEPLSVTRNIFMGREMKRLFWMQMKEMAQESEDALARIGVHFSASSPVANLSGGERKSVAIARALYFNSKLIMMDEPTNDLSITESERLIDMTRALVKQKGVSVIWISHNVYDVYRCCDNIKLLDRGREIADYKPSEISFDELRERMIETVRSRLSAHHASAPPSL